MRRGIWLFPIVALLLSWHLPPCDAQVLLVSDTPGQRVRKISTTGADLGVFSATGFHNPNGLALDSASNVYAANYGASDVTKYGPGGAFLGSIANIGFPRNPLDVAFDAAGNFFVSTPGSGPPATSGEVYKFTSTGAPLGVFASGLNGAWGMAFDASGNLYVAEQTGGRIHRFSPTGTDLGVFASGIGMPIGIQFDATGNLYVADSVEGAIREFSSTGAPLGDFATGVAGATDIVFDVLGNAYVPSVNGSVTKLSSAGSIIGVFTIPGMTGADGIVYVRGQQSVPENSGAGVLATALTVGLAAIGSNRRRLRLTNG